MEKILTIAVPAYNMEKYISRCIESVVSIRLLDKLDIIVVNDGSKDCTLDIARRYEQRYPQSVRVIDKPNGGWGTAINLSINEAKGKYYKSLDSDDWFDSSALELYVDLLSKIDVDMVLTSYNEVNEDGQVTGGIRWNNYTDQTYIFDEYLNKLDGGYRNTIHAITYRTKMLQENHVSVSERFYGDLDYINTPLVYVKSIYVSTLNIYQYFVGREGQSVSVEGYKKHIDDYLAVTRKAVIFNVTMDKNVSAAINTILWNETIARALWAYRLLLLPVYLGNETSSRQKLKILDTFIKSKHIELYRALGKIKVKGIIPYIWVWRVFGVNLFKLYRV